MANRGNRQKKGPKILVLKTHYKKRLNNTLNIKGEMDGQTLGRMKRIIIVALI